MIGYCNENGEITFSEEVLAQIIGLSTMECYGVVGMVAKKPTDGLWELMRKENLAKGVQISLNEKDKLKIELYIMVEYGAKISVISSNIVQRVRYSVEKYTSLKVSSISVNIQAVRI